jgi:hypothetical protein
MQIVGFVVGTLIWTALSATVSADMTWLVLAVAVSLGLWLTVFLRYIPPKLELEAISR